MHEWRGLPRLGGPSCGWEKGVAIWATRIEVNTSENPSSSTKAIATECTSTFGGDNIRASRSARQLVEGERLRKKWEHHLGYHEENVEDNHSCKGFLRGCEPRGEEETKAERNCLSTYHSHYRGYHNGVGLLDIDSREINPRGRGLLTKVRTLDLSGSGWYKDEGGERREALELGT